MKLFANVFDVWVFRKSGSRTEYLLLYTSQQKADRYYRFPGATLIWNGS